MIKEDVSTMPLLYLDSSIIHRTHHMISGYTSSSSSRQRKVSLARVIYLLLL
jgi:hypothetical protein